MKDSERRKLLNEAVGHLKKTKVGYDPTKPHWQAAFSMLRRLDDDLKPDIPPKPHVPPLGPVEKGGESLLRASLTHQTDGLPLYPAHDTAWKAGTVVIAPEDGTVTRHSGGPSGGYSVYMTGRSGLQYYATHLKDSGRHALGKIAKGAKLGIVGDPRTYPAQRVAHCHFGINIEKVAGKGKQLKYGKTGRGPDYTTGSPSVGVQLASILK